MLRRGVTAIPRALVSSTKVARRFAAKPAWARDDLIKVYDSPFETAQYPENVIGGEHITFAKLLFQFSKAEKKEDKYVADMTTGLAQAIEKAGPFWADKNIGDDAAFSNLEAGVRFTLRWMQQNRQLEKLNDVVEIFKLYVNSSRQTMVASVQLAGLPSGQKANLDKAKAAAQRVFDSHFPTKKGWKLVFEENVDPGIIDGWRVNVGGYVAEDMSAYRKAAAEAAAAGEVIDYTAVPAVAARPTVWPENIETEILSQWCADLSNYDLEEQKYGV